MRGSRQDCTEKSLDLTTLPPIITESSCDVRVRVNTALKCLVYFGGGGVAPPSYFLGGRQPPRSSATEMDGNMG